jgi:hypothetical protein
MRKLLLVVLAAAIVASGCSSDQGEELIAIRASIDPAVGDERFLFAVNEIDGTRRGSPEEVVTVRAKALDAPDVVHEVAADFLWIIEDSIGLYRAAIPFDRAGQWEIDFDVSTGEKTQPFLVLVAEEPATVAIGERAPVVATPTVADTPLEDLTTDFPIHEAFYQLSLDDALTNGNRTVAIFATPAFCTSAACGPMIRQTKEISESYPDVNWVHVEVYQGFNDEGFQPDVDHLAPAVVDFGLPSEPWIFVMDEEGIVVARIEGVLGDGELESILGT